MDQQFLKSVSQWSYTSNRREKMSEVISYISIGVAISSLLYTAYRTRKQDIASLENRITILEQNQFTSSDKTCLHEVDVKMKLFWSIVEKEFPNILHSDKTPQIDKLLEKASKGTSNLSESEKKTLIKSLSNEKKEALKHNNKSRALVVDFYTTVLQYNSSCLRKSA